MNLAEYGKQHRTRERGNEDGSVKQTGKRQKKWEGVYHVYVDGKRITRRRIIGECAKLTKTQARNEHREWIRRLNEKPVADTSKATVGQLADDWFVLRSGDWDIATRRTNRSLIDSIIKPGLGAKSLDSVTAEDLKAFLNSLPSRRWHPTSYRRLPDGTLKANVSKKLRTGVSHSYVKKSITVLRALFDLADERELVRKNPARSITVRLTVPKATKKVDKSVLPAHELPALLAHLDARDSLIVWLSMLGATRPGELFATKGGDVGPQWVYIQRALDCRGGFKETKTDNPRTVALPPHVARELQDWIKRNQIGRDDLLFTGDRRWCKEGPLPPLNRASFLKHRLRPAAKRAGISTLDVDFQMLRRSFATLAVAIGFDVKSIQAQMGHAKPDMSLGEYAQSVDLLRLSKMTELEQMLRGEIPLPFEALAKLETRLVQ